MNELYQGKLEKKNIDNGLEELKNIKCELEKLTPAEVVWEIDDLGAKPPWGDDINPEIQNLSTYFVTSDGENLIEVFEKALSRAKDLKEDLLIDSL